MKDNNRLLWVDALKGFGMLLVILGHLGIAYPIERHIYSYHMFFFFSISGLLRKNRTFNETLIKKTKVLLVPFLFWNLTSSIVGALIYHQSVKDFLKVLFIVKGQMCFNAPIWFILVLYFTEIIYALFNRKGEVISTKKIATIMIGSLCIFILIGTMKLPLKINLVPLAMFSYSGGILLKNYVDVTRMLSRCVRGGGCDYIIMLICGIFSLLFGMHLNDRISYTQGDFGNRIYCIIAAVSGTIFFILLFWKIFYKCKETNILVIIGRHTFPLMSMQYWLFTLYKYLFNKMFEIDDIWNIHNSIKAVVLTFVTVVLIIGFVKFYKKFFTTPFFHFCGKMMGI